MKGYYYVNADGDIGRIDDTVELSGVAYFVVHWTNVGHYTMEDACELASENVAFYATPDEAIRAAAEHAKAA